jgi:hypothetical protein
MPLIAITGAIMGLVITIQAGLAYQETGQALTSKATFHLSCFYAGIQPWRF